jgi:signal peptidase I
MTEVIQKPRRPWVALLLSFLMPGLGHLYNGNTRQGIQFFVFYFLSINFMTFAWLYLLPTSDLFMGILAVNLFLFLFIGISAFRQAGQILPGRELNWYARWYGLFLIYAFWAAFTHLVNPTQLYVQSFNIKGNSMAPVIEEGDSIWTKNAAYQVRIPGTDRIMMRLNNPDRGDIVIFKYPGDESKVFIQRVIGLPGETIEIKNRKVLINNSPLSEAYAVDTNANAEPFRGSPVYQDHPPLIIPDDSYYVIGDNRDRSLDSRTFGPVQYEMILGRASLLVFSYDKINLKVRWERIGTRFD